MAQKFWAIYEALRDGTQLKTDDFDKFIYHIQWELEQKHKSFTGQSILQSPQLVEDLKQQICGAVAIGVKRHKFNPDSNTFKNWVDGIVLNTLRNHYSKNKHHREREISLDGLLDAGADWGASEEQEPDLLLIDAETEEERLKLLAKALQILRKGHPKYHQVLYNRYFEERTTAQTAKLLNTDHQDISRTLNRAKGKLSEIVSALSKHSTTSI